MKEKLEKFQSIMIDMATGKILIDRETGKIPDEQANLYCKIRDELISHSNAKTLIPDIVHSCRDLEQFWHYISAKYSTYKERRVHIWDSLGPVFSFFEEQMVHPSDLVIAGTLSQLDLSDVLQNWQRSLDRRFADPEAAITSARTLLESTCKHILTEENEPYQEDWDLPRLYKTVARRLNLAPDQHTEQIFKQILGGCQTVVEGLGSIRNKLGDAHGKSPKTVKPTERHAKLAVNLAGTMSTFLIETWQSKKT